MQMRLEDLSLEVTTIRLINTVHQMSAGRTHTRAVREATGIDLPPSDLRVLEFLSGRGPVPTGTVASQLGVDLAQLSRQASQLETAGHLVRCVDPADRRRRLVALSPDTTALLEKWLLLWTPDYLEPLAGWSEEDLLALARCFEYVLERLSEAVPGSPHLMASEAWAALAGDDYGSAALEVGQRIIDLVTWVGQSRGITDLLVAIDSPIGAHGFATLQTTHMHGPLSVAEVAELLAIDPSQASKRLRMLTDLKLVDRAVNGFDRRSNLIRINRKGRALISRVDEFQINGFAMIMADLTTRERECWTPLVGTYVHQLLGSTTGPEGMVPEAEGSAFSH